MTGTRGARELRVLRTVLSAEKAGKINWEDATPQDLFTAADVYRLYPPFGDEQGNPVAPGGRTTSKAGAEDPVISSPIPIGDRRIFLRCIGSGKPTVILEAGYGDNGTIWAPVQIHASEFVRVCSYDRAGLERSDEPPHYPRTGAEVVADLHAALQAAQVEPPTCSSGSPMARSSADSSPRPIRMRWQDCSSSTRGRRTSTIDLQAMVTDEQWTAYEACWRMSRTMKSIDFHATYDELRSAGALPDVPLLILSHGQPPSAACCPKGWPIAEQEQLWQQLQQELAKLTSSGEQRVVPESGHMIHQAAPDVVIDAIAEMVERLRN